MRTSFRFQLVR